MVKSLCGCRAQPPECGSLRHGRAGPVRTGSRSLHLRALPRLGAARPLGVAGRGGCRADAEAEFAGVRVAGPRRDKDGAGCGPAAKGHERRGQARHGRSHPVLPGAWWNDRSRLRLTPASPRPCQAASDLEPDNTEPLVGLAKCISDRGAWPGQGSERFICPPHARLCFNAVFEPAIFADGDLARSMATQAASLSERVRWLRGSSGCV